MGSGYVYHGHQTFHKSKLCKYLLLPSSLPEMLTHHSMLNILWGVLRTAVAATSACWNRYYTLPYHTSYNGAEIYVHKFSGLASDTWLFTLALVNKGLMLTQCWYIVRNVNSTLKAIVYSFYKGVKFKQCFVVLNVLAKYFYNFNANTSSSISHFHILY